MKSNMGMVDRIVRFVVAIAVIALYFAHVISGTLAIVLLVVAAIFILTSFVSFCPLYTLVGLNTKGEKKA